MPYARSNGVRIRYETEGSGPPLLLHTGFMGTLESWAEAGYIAALRDRFRLIRLDPRGQGQSDKSHDPAAYADRTRVADVLAVLDAERIERTHFWGYSLGAGVGFWTAIAAPERLHSFIAGGVNAFPPEGRPVDSDEGIVALRKGIPALAAELEAADPHCWTSPRSRERFLANDADALIAARTKRLTERNLSEADVAAIRVPALVYAGSNDDAAGAERPARVMPNATFVLFDGLDHATAFTCSDLVLPPVLAFLSSAGSGNAASA
jgi:pimeloyl-ACP methyl ester carboxylesterase